MLRLSILGCTPGLDFRFKNLEHPLHLLIVVDALLAALVFGVALAAFDG